MARSKADYWLTDDGLTLIEGWARDGLIDSQIAHNMNVSYTTFKEYKKKYPTILAALKKSKEIVDYEVENSLLQRCFGYNAKVKKHLKVKKTEYKEGMKVKEYEEIVEVDDEVHIPADTLAQIYWLKNRQIKKWRDKPETESGDGDDGVMIINDLPKASKVK